MAKRAKKKTPEQEIWELRVKIIQEITDWKYINKNGCNDPFWADGSNMNLVRNHIIYYKKQIREICEEYNLQIPGEVYIPTPPEVDENYMANLKQRERVNRLRREGDKLTTKKNNYSEEQLSLF